MSLAYLPIDIPMHILDENKILDWFEKHQELLARSLEKFKNQAIYL